MKVTLILKGAADQFNRLPVYVRTSEGQKRTFKKTDVKITKEQYDRFQNNTHLPKERELYQRYLSLMDAPVVQEYPDAYFKEYSYDCLRQWNKTKRDSTLSHLKTEIDFFVAFAGNKKLSKITVQMLNDYKKHITTENGLGNNTAWKKFKALKTIFNKAVKERVIELSPFTMFENVKYKQPEKKYLTKEQVEDLERYTKEEIPDRIRFVATWFLIGCYTGLRFSDMKQFGRHLIKNGRLTMYTVKTNEPVSLPMNGKLTELFETVGYKPVDISNQKMNEYLKIVSSAADLPALNVHMARHTFAVRCADAHISPEVCAKLMGITNLKVVAVYYKLNSPRMDDEYGKLFC